VSTGLFFGKSGQKSPVDRTRDPVMRYIYITSSGKRHVSLKRSGFEAQSGNVV